jgi:hypothetical protein
LRKEMTRIFDGFVSTRHAGGDHAVFHLMEQPTLGICSAGPSPVRATCDIAA